MRFCWCPPGEFLMGSPVSEAERGDAEGPQRTVRLTQGFWLAKYPVTQIQWAAAMGGNPSQDEKGDDRPVDSVSWDDSLRFCEKLGLWLPAEAQWEYACRAGTEKAFAIGGGAYLNAQMANFDGNYPYGDGANAFEWKYRRTTVGVGSFPPNAWGLHDMHGQFWEWCHDWRGDYPDGPATDPSGPRRGDDRVLRGGSWINFGRFARSAIRYGSTPGTRNIIRIGLRPSSTRPEPEAEGRSVRSTGKREA